MIGGALTQYVTWRAVFWINIPIGLLALVLAMAGRPSNERLPGARLPLRPAVLLVAGCGGLVCALQQGSVSRRMGAASTLVAPRIPAATVPSLDELTRRPADSLLMRLRKTFDATFEGHGDLRDLAWFPAWALTEKPALSHPLSQAQRSLDTEPEQAMRLLRELLGLERQGRRDEVIARRKALRDAHPSLYAAYMKAR